MKVFTELKTKKAIDLCLEYSEDKEKLENLLKEISFEAIGGVYQTMERYS